MRALTVTLSESPRKECCSEEIPSSFFQTFEIAGPWATLAYGEMGELQRDHVTFGALTLHDKTSGEVENLVLEPGERVEKPMHLPFSPSKDAIVVTTTGPKDPSPSLHVYHRAKGWKRVQSWSKGPFIGFHATGHWLFFGENPVHVFDLKTGELKDVAHFPEGHPDAVHLSQGREQLISICPWPDRRHKLMIYDPEKKQEILLWEGLQRVPKEALRVATHFPYRLTAPRFLDQNCGDLHINEAG